VAQFGHPRAFFQALQDEPDQVAGKRAAGRVGHVVLLPPGSGQREGQPAEMRVWKTLQMADVRAESLIRSARKEASSGSPLEGRGREERAGEGRLLARRFPFQRTGAHEPYVVRTLRQGI